MNKQERIDSINQKIKELQEEVNKLQSEPDTSELVFKPEKGERYEYIGYLGGIRCSTWNGNNVDFDRLAVGNVFRVGTAKNSAKYYFMNSEYDYWLPWSGQPKPKVLPKGLEFWNLNYGEWDDSGYKDPSLLDNRHVYRWKRSEQ